MKTENQSVDYNQTLRSNIPHYVRLIDRLFPLANLNRRDLAGRLLSGGSSILDIGSGDGAMLRQYAQKKYNLLGAVDVASKPLKNFKRWAQKRGVNHLTYSQDFLEIKTKRKFDTITALAYLEHQMSPFQHLKKASDLLKPGGQLIVEVPNTAYILFRLSLLRGKFPMTAHHAGCIPGVVDAHIRFFSPSTMNQLLTYCGFEIEIMTCTGRFQPLRSSFQLLWPDIFVVARKVKPCPKIDPIRKASSQ